MPSITSFLKGGKDRAQRNIDLQGADLSKEERRKLEMNLLPAEQLPKYTGELPTATNEVESLAVKLFFETEKDVALFKKYFKVLEYIEANCRELTLLRALLEALEGGVIEYDEEEEEITVARAGSDDHKGSQSIRKIERRRTRNNW